MYFGLILVLLILAFFRQRTRYSFMYFVSILILAILLAFNRGNPDYDSYIAIFENPQFYAEAGYTFLVKLIKQFGGNSHSQVLLVLGIFFVITLNRFSRYVKNMSFVMLLYALFPYIIDVIQIRNTFMILFVLNALIEYINKRKVKCLIYLILGTSIHSFGIIFIFVFLVINFLKRESYHKLIPIVGGINFFAIPITIKILTSYIYIPRVSERLILYIPDSSKFQSLASWGLVLLADVLLFKFIMNHKNLKENTKQTELIKMTYDLIYFGIAIFPGLLYLNEFSRYFRDIFILRYLLIGCALPILNKFEKIFFIFYALASATLFSIIYYFKVVDYNVILKQINLFGF